MITPFAETKRITKLIQNSGMSEKQFFERQIALWMRSKTRREQLQGELYYHGTQDILRRERTVIGKGGKREKVYNLPNNRIVDNQYAKMVDQKANYLLGKPFTIQCENKTYAQKLSQVFNRRFARILHHVGVDSLNGGIGWIAYYYDEQGRPGFKRIPPFQVLPFWADDEHTVLDCAIRLYPQEVWEGEVRKTVWRAEIYKPDGVWRYLYQNGTLLPETERKAHEDYLQLTDSQGRTNAYNWVHIPLIPFKLNGAEIPLIRRVKTLQDGLNQILSDWQNNMEEDARNTILVLTNYDGENLDEFRHNLAAYGAIKVRSDGGVSTLQVEVNGDNYTSIIKVFKDKIIENARGFDAKDDRLGNSPNQMNIRSMYSDIDLDANEMETEYQAGMEELLWFVIQYYQHSGDGDFTEEKVEIIFHRDILSNESESIDNCVKSEGIISRETILAKHPFVDDVQAEQKRLKKEEKDSLGKGDVYQNAFAAQQEPRQNQSGEAEE